MRLAHERQRLDGRIDMRAGREITKEEFETGCTTLANDGHLRICRQ